MSVTVYNSRIDGQVAYQYGPVVLAADLGSVSNVSGVNEYISNETKIDSVTTDVPYIVGNSSNLDKYIDTVDLDKLMFEIKAEIHLQARILNLNRSMKFTTVSILYIST